MFYKLEDSTKYKFTESEKSNCFHNEVLFFKPGHTNEVVGRPTFSKAGFYPMWRINFADYYLNRVVNKSR